MMQAIDALEAQGLSPEEATLEATLNHSSVMGNIRDDEEPTVRYLYAKSFWYGLIVDGHGDQVVIRLLIYSLFLFLICYYFCF